MWSPFHHHLKKFSFYLRMARHYHVGGKMSADGIRRSFIDYFVQEHDHTFVRSSPVVPFSDPSLAFVNAGMNQFKGILLGNTLAPCLRAANSQKCIRVGGKHNDLAVVGTDGYHHTFFEMLGSWSFGDYFKKEACELAWNLLTGQYGLNPSRLYVTYFGGDSAMGLRPDLETRDIWRQIGISPDHILPFGSNDNFWEMGISGPCGPCTEIHVDHVAGRQCVADRVNMGHYDVTEIWNLVFIQHNRNADGSLNELSCQHVDTGMGLERLVAVLQGKESNYDTDLFEPLFSAIHKHSRGVPMYKGHFNDKDEIGIDTGYRILADHARMVTVALADGMFPDQNYKLRRVMRKAMLLSQQKFGVEFGLLRELTNYVAESLGEVYPEIVNRLKEIQLIIDHEEELLRSLRIGAADDWQKILFVKPELSNLDIVEMPGLVAGYHELSEFARTVSENGSAITKSPKSSTEIELKETFCIDSLNVTIPNDLAYKLYDTYGLEETVIKELARVEGFQVDSDGFRHLLNVAKVRVKESFASEVENEHLHVTIGDLVKCGLNLTQDTLKYSYTKESDVYVFPSVKSEVKAVIVNGELVSSAEPEMECSIILDQTCFYHESGGQASDIGQLITTGGSTFLVTGVTNCMGCILHHGYVKKEGNGICVGDIATVEVDEKHRLGNMRNHTATHLLNAALHKILTVTNQKSSRVTESNLVFDFSVYGETFNVQNVEEAEKMVQSCVKTGVPVTRRTMSANELLSLDNVTLVPGEVYPEQDIHIIEVEAGSLFTSREACCGTHVLNTADIKDFCIVSVKTAGSGTRSLKALTGDFASLAHQAGHDVSHKVTDLVAEVEGFINSQGPKKQAELLDEKLYELKQMLTSGTQSLPYSVRSRELQKIDVISRKLKESARGSLRDALESEMQTLLRSNEQPFLVHFLKCSSTMDTVPLQKATRMCPQIPILLLAHSEGVVKARCCVPKTMVSQNFNAQLWMHPVLQVLKSQGAAPRGQDPHIVFNMKGKKLSPGDLDTLMKVALDNATDYARCHLKPAGIQTQFITSQ